MTKKQDQTTEQTFGIAAMTPAGMNSLAIYEAMEGSMSTALSKFEERIEQEAHKHLLIERLQGTKTRYGEQQIAEIYATTAIEYNRFTQQLKAIKQTFTGDPYDAYSDAFNHVLAQGGAKQMAEAAAVGSARIIEEIGRSLYLKEEERKRIFGIF